MTDEVVCSLPAVLPLLAIHEVVLLPRARLPVPVSEVDYLSLISESVKTNAVVGVVQPILQRGTESDSLCPLFQSGCAGKIVSVMEVMDNQLIVTLSGICRFDIIRELVSSSGHRKAEVSYDRYLLDSVEEVDFSFDRPRLLRAVEGYFKLMEISINWQEISNTSNERLVTALAMICPFEAREKQALLEMPSPKDQSQLITDLIEFAMLESPGQIVTCH